MHKVDTIFFYVFMFVNADLSVVVQSIQKFEYNLNSFVWFLAGPFVLNNFINSFSYYRK